MRGLGDGRVFLITGGAGGIGSATAEILASHGGRVVITDVLGEQGEEVVAGLNAGEGQIRYLDMDVTSPDDVRRVAARLEEEDWPVYGVMANAGVAPSAPAADYPDDTWRTTIDINLNGAFWTVREFGRRMIERGAGAVVITSSIAGFGTVSPETHVAYGSTKAAVAHMARLLGVEWARTGVRVNAVAPGYTATPILDRLKEEAPDVFDQWLARIPMGRLNTPEEIGNAAAFLFSDLASGMTGAVLNVDGGYSAR
ncbi:MAG TPA: SDR family oxidoreductase [Intrasporangiaceae bacterium]|nr:SDR family oxidoreductase [Intrasporangiaceae bacterium]